MKGYTQQKAEVIKEIFDAIGKEELIATTLSRAVEESWNRRNALITERTGLSVFKKDYLLNAAKDVFKDIEKYQFKHVRKRDLWSSLGIGVEVYDYAKDEDWLIILGQGVYAMLDAKKNSYTISWGTKEYQAPNTDELLILALILMVINEYPVETPVEEFRKLIEGITSKDKAGNVD